MADIGKASLLVVPRFDGLRSSVNKALGSVDTSGLGKSQGKAYSGGFETGIGGLGKSGAIVGVFSAVTTKAMSAITSHIDSATARFDTLNNFPKIMTTLGYSSESASASIKKMSERLQGLPTKLDDMSSTVQGIAAITGDLDLATDAGLALNDMLLAAGSSTQLSSAAMEQFRQVLAKGKPEMQDWRALTSAMPGQMKQLAQEMLGANATADDLYKALGGGGEQATVTTDQLLKAMIKLDNEGGAGITSFAKQAKTATDGVATSAENLGNAFTRGIAGVMEAVGKQNIASAFGTAKTAVDTFFKIVQSGTPAAVSAFNGVVKVTASVAPQIVSITAGVLAFTKLSPAIKAIGGTFKDVFAGAQLKAESFGASIKKLVTGINPLSLGIAAVTTAMVAVGIAVADYTIKQKKANDAIKAMQSASADTSALSNFSGQVEGIGVAAATARVSLEDYYQSMQSHADAIIANNEKAKETIAVYNTISSIVDEYCGKASEGVKITDLSAESQGRLAYAAQQLSDKLGVTVTAQDVLNGSYVDGTGAAQDLKAAVDDLCEAKIKEAKTSAIMDDITEVYEQQRDAVKQLSQAQKDYADNYSNSYKAAIALGYSDAEAQQYAADATKYSREQMEKFNGQVDDASEQLDGYYAELGQVQSGSEDLSLALANLGNDFLDVVSVDLGSNIDELSAALQAAGISAQDLNAIGTPQLIEFAQSSGGSMETFIGSVRDACANLDASKQTMTDTITSWQTGIDSVTVQNLVNEFANAGISAQQLNAIGSDNFNALWSTCNGDVSLMVAKINEYRNTPMGDKYSTAVATGNGVNGAAKAAIDEFRRTQMGDKRSVAAVSGNAVDGSAEGSVRSTIRAGAGLVDKFVRWNISQVFTSSGTRYNAQGGIRLHADGGFVPRFHAGGAIATKAVPLDVVGEAGAEAIVPLTNEKYSKPFAKTLARQMDGGGKFGNVYNIYLDGKLLEADQAVKDAVAALVGSAKRQTRMGWA